MLGPTKRKASTSDPVMVSKRRTLVTDNVTQKILSAPSGISSTVQREAHVDGTIKSDISPLSVLFNAGSTKGKASAGVSGIVSKQKTLSENAYPSSNQLMPKSLYVRHVLKLKRSTLLGDWDRRGVFDIRGGTLNKYGSGVELSVPQKAVDSRHEAEIWGNVYTDLTKFGAMFGLTDTDRFVSPIVEFTEQNGIKFSRHLQIKIPIAYEKKSGESVRVLSIQGGDKPVVVEIPCFATALDETTLEMYYKLQDGFVYVYTKHFTAFSCVESGCNKIHLQGLLFGLRRNDSGTSEVELRLYLCDPLVLIEDFRKTLCDQEAVRGLERIDQKQIKMVNPSLSDEISVNIDLKEPWSLKTKLNGGLLFLNKTQLLRHISCGQGFLVPSLIGEWEITTDRLTTKFWCSIDVVHLPKEITRIPTCTTFSVTLSDAQQPNVNIPCQSNRKTNDILVKDLCLSDARNLARKLKVPETRIKDIQENYSKDARECVQQLVYAMQQGTGSDFFEQLCIALVEIGRVDIGDKV